MKKLLIIFTLLALTNCQVKDKPEFKEIKNVSVDKISSKNVTVIAEAVFYNPNDIGYELVGSEVTVYVNNKAVGKTNQQKNIIIKSNSDFEVPFSVDFALKDIMDESENLLTSIIKNAINRKIDIAFDGKITLKKAGISFDVPFKHEQEIKL